MKKVRKCNSCGTSVFKIDNPPYAYECKVCKKEKFAYETYNFISLFSKGIVIILLVLACKPPKYNPDTDPNILDWYVDGNDTVIYTKQDSIKDARERWEYIRSIDNDSLWE